MVLKCPRLICANTQCPNGDLAIALPCITKTLILALLHAEHKWDVHIIGYLLEDNKTKVVSNIDTSSSIFRCRI